jgi:hypothetical protein
VASGSDLLAGASDDLRHRLNNLFARIIACAEGAMDAAEEPRQVRAMMEELIGCIERPRAAEPASQELANG